MSDPDPQIPALPVPSAPTERSSVLVADRPLPPWAEALADHLASGHGIATFRGAPETTVHRWMRQSTALMEVVAHARRVGCAALAERLPGIAEGPGDDLDTNVRVQRDRLRGDTVRWILSVWDPATYGARQAAGSAGVTVNVVTGVPTPDARPTAARVTVTTGDGAGDRGRAGGDAVTTGEADTAEPA